MLVSGGASKRPSDVGRASNRQLDADERAHGVLTTTPTVLVDGAPRQRTAPRRSCTQTRHTYIFGRVLGERRPVEARLGAALQIDRAAVLGKGTAGRQGIMVLVSRGTSMQTSDVRRAKNWQLD